MLCRQLKRIRFGRPRLWACSCTPTTSTEEWAWQTSEAETLPIKVLTNDFGRRVARGMRRVESTVRIYCGREMSRQRDISP